MMGWIKVLILTETKVKINTLRVKNEWVIRIHFGSSNPSSSVGAKIPKLMNVKKTIKQIREIFRTSSSN